MKLLVSEQYIDSKMHGEAIEVIYYMFKSMNRYVRVTLLRCYAAPTDKELPTFRLNYCLNLQSLLVKRVSETINIFV